MKTTRSILLCAQITAALLLGTHPLPAQFLLNVDFGAGTASPKTGLAATGTGTNDFWNLYRHYEPRFVPGMPLVANGKLEKLKLFDGSESAISLAVMNAPGVWGNASGDPMYDSYMFAPNGSNIAAVIRGLPPGRYHFYLYGHADADVGGEQNSVFTVKAGTNTFGPLAQSGGNGWKAGNGWLERAQYVVFRDVATDGGPVFVEAAPGPNGVAVLNGLQVLSRGTSPPRLIAAGPASAAPANTNLLFRDIHYEGKVSDNEARFAVSFTAESLTTNEISAPLFEGEVALLSPELPKGLRVVGQGRQTRLFCASLGVHTVKLELLARVTKAEPWNQITFAGPAAAIASVSATATTPGVELQLLSGTPVSPAGGAAGSLQGFLGADRTLSLRWQSKGAEVARKSLVTVDTAATAQITPTVVKFNTVLRYEILQAPIARLRLELPKSQALTRIQGEQIRDWQVQAESDRQVLTVEFIRPVEKSCALTLFTEQPLEKTPLTATLVPPGPLEVERESGSFTLSADDTTVELDSASGLRQVNAPAGALAAFQFHGRPIAIVARLTRIEPLLKLADRATGRLEETRLVVSHALTLDVEKAGIYSLDITPQPGFVVSEVKGDGIDDWRVADGKLKVAFASRVLGSRKLNIQLEEAHPSFPDKIVLLPLTVAGATNVTTQLGAGAAPGIRLKTAELSRLREVPVASLPNWDGELLAFAGDQPDWRLELATEKLAPRVVAEVFNLVTIGDGLVGGSATLRYGILNQGVQEFRIAVPSHWKNIEFTGANIRRKEQQTNVWTITLQDKAWGGYTLVLTYDYPFDPKGATLNLAGAHVLDAERETGSLGLMTAASLKLTPEPPAGPLQRVDETELSERDRALCTRPLVLAYKYNGGDYRQSVQVTRFEQVPVLDAVADRTELTTVLTEEGQLLTQSSFMVKNNEKQFQRFKLPKDADFWSSYVNGQPAKPQRDGDWYLVPLPRDANRDQAFAVDIVYAQTNNPKGFFFPHQLTLTAPVTDIPNTYAEWQLFAPPSQRLSSFAGNMTVASGTLYTFHDAWQQFLSFYGDLIEHHFGEILGGFVVCLVLVLIGAALRRGVKGTIEVIVVFSILAILAAMLLPALSKAKSRAQRISVVNNLHQIGKAVRMWGMDNGDQMPPNFEAMKEELGTEKVTLDPSTGQRLVYVGNGKSEANPEAIIAFSPSDVNGRAVLFADGSVQVLNQEKFEQAMQRDAALPRAVFSANAPPAPPEVAAAPPPTAARGGGGRITFANNSTTLLPPGRVAAPVASEAAAAPPMIAVDPATGLPIQPGTFGGGVGGGGGIPVPAQPPVRATATGVRPIRIEIPRAGQAFNFTKVLNANREPLAITASLMRLKVYRGLEMCLQVSGFVLGLLLLWILSLSARPRSFGMALALGLVLWSVASLLKMWRLLHVGLIVAAPLIIFGLLAWLAWTLWRRHRSAHPPAIPPTGTDPASQAAVSLLVVAALFGSTAGLRADGPALAVPDSVSIRSAAYEGIVGDKVARLDATIQLSTAATNQTVPLFGEDVALESFAADADARLLRDGRFLSVLVPSRGDVKLQFKLVAKLGGDVARRQLAFGIPPALASQAKLVIDEPDADVECPAAVSLERTNVGQQTRVQAVLGAADRFELNWTPRMKHAAEIAATVFVQNTALVTLGGGVINTRATLDYQVSQGELRQLRVRLPAEHRVLRVEGDSLRLWEVKDEVLTVDLLKGVSPACKLIIETEKLLDKFPATARLEIPHALDVKRETGLLGWRTSEELSVSVQEAQELQQVDAEEFYRAAPDKKDGLAGAFRFLKPDFTLSVRAETVQPQIEAVVWNRVRLESEAVRLTARIEYTIKRAGVFALRLGLPEGYRLESVTGPAIAQWTERTTDDSRLLEVTLKERTLGSCTLDLTLARSYKDLPKTLPLAGVHPIGAEKLSGFVIVSTDLGLGAKTASLEGLTEIPFDRAAVAGALGDSALPAQTGGLAYKFISPNPGPAPSWALAVATETVEPWLRAEVMNTIVVTETLVSGRSLVKYDIANAPVKEFRVRVPGVFRNVELNGAQIRRRDQTNDEWRVELQGKVRGQYFLTVTWELPRGSDTAAVELEGVQALGVERETGFLSIIARPPLQVAEKSATELLSRIDSRELPDWAGRPDASTVLAYRYVRPGYKLAVEARRFSEAEVLQALIENARLTTVIADDGQAMTEVSLSIRNNGRQHLEIELPAGATVWSAFVAGDPVRPSKRGGQLLLPLTRDIASDAAVAVDLTFVGAEAFPKYHGAVALASPKFDLPMKNARWDLYLPPDYDYSGFEGSMSRTSDTTAPMEQVFSLSEYNEKQRAQADQQQMEVQYGIKSARENLSVGNLREAVGSFNRAKSRGQQLSQAGEGEQDLKQVEQELRRAQGGNLIAAQNSYFAANAGDSIGQRAVQAQVPVQAAAQSGRQESLFLNNDAEVAGLQWDKLANAQQVAETKVAPLRVNLPTRGIHYSFSQMLQTELRRPLTLKLLAQNTKVPSWTGRVATAALAFGLLWLLTALINRQRASKVS